MNSIFKTATVPVVILTGLLALFAIPPSHGAEPSSEKTVIHIGTLPGLRFDTTAFSVRPEAEVELTFSNQDDMLHNLVITAPGARMEIVMASIALGAQAVAKEFVPDSEKVLWATQIVPSGESYTLRFTAPSALGEYPYVCTYPGHGFIMFGTMIVTRDPQPPVQNTSPALMTAVADHEMHHLDKAIVKRTFMPDSGPASIAVGLPGDYSYCWDAGACRFRYAWKGGYVREVYRRPQRIVGDVFYREEPGFPVRIGPNPNVAPDRIQFRGYGLDVMGYPEFEYEVNGVEIRERLEVRDGRLVRRFKTNAEGKTVWFAIPPENASQLAATGAKQDSFFKFDGSDAREFYVTISPPED